MVWIFSAGALAAPSVVGLGVEAVTNDPFVSTVGLHASVDQPIRPWLRLGASGGVYPSLGQGSWSALTTQIVTEANVTPDISAIRWRASAQATWLPVRQELPGRSRLLGLYAGMGWVYTVDDLDALQSYDDEDLATQMEFHPIVSGGLMAEVWWSSWGGRVRMERASYTETISSAIDESRNPFWLGIDLTARWP